MEYTSTSGIGRGTRRARSAPFHLRSLPLHGERNTQQEDKLRKFANAFTIEEVAQARREGRVIAATARAGGGGEEARLVPRSGVSVNRPDGRGWEGERRSVERSEGRREGAVEKPVNEVPLRGARVSGGWTLEVGSVDVAYAHRL